MIRRHGPDRDEPTPLRVLTSVPGRGVATNPYLLQLIDALAAQPGIAGVRYFSWRTAVTGDWDVLHVHWPERLVRGASRRGTLVRRVLFALLLVRLRLRRGVVVRTLHNVASHEPGDPVERALLDSLDRRTALWIRLNPFTPAPAGRPVRTIVHGHYRDWFPAGGTAPDAGALLFFGLLRPYKGVEELLAAFAPTTDLTLRLVGRAQDAGLGAEVERAAERDPRVSARLEYTPDDQLADEVRRAALVVLPYRAVHNSGAAILALSLGRPVLMPRSATTVWLADEVGADWVRLYDGPLTHEVLQAAAALPLPAGEPPLADRDWAAIAAAHVEAFEAVRGR